MNKTKIVCTIGPATSSEEALRELHAVGMDMARLNGSHADLDWHRGVIARLRKVLPTTPILMDIPGRKIRTVQLKHEPSFREGETIHTENSYKYTVDGFEDMANKAGWQLDTYWTDERDYFAVFLLKN